MEEAKQILKAITKEHTGDLSYSEAKEALHLIDDCLSGDHYFELDGMEFRIIHEDDIWDIYIETIKDITEDCYLSGNELPSFLEIDWERTNCLVDGYGHTFSTYDGSELFEANHYIFRTN